MSSIRMVQLLWRAVSHGEDHPLDVDQIKSLVEVLTSLLKLFEVCKPICGTVYHG